MLSQYQVQIGEITGKIPVVLADFQERNGRLLDEAEAALEQVNALNLQMKSVIDQAEADASTAGMILPITGTFRTRPESLAQSLLRS